MPPIRLAIAILTLAAMQAADPALVLTPSRADALYAPGATIAWRVELTDCGAGAGKAAWTVRRGGTAVIAQGQFDLAAGPATAAAMLDGPGTAMLEVVAKIPGRKDLQAFAGAAVEPRRIAPSLPPPDDFDDFWKGKLAELATVPMNPVLEKQPAERDGLDYWHIAMDNVRGTRIHGQLARPSREGRLPAMLVVQWAGVYPLQKGFVTGIAPQGWLVLNINAHDLPIDKPADFYKQLADTTLKGYTSIGSDDREKSYFLRMFLSCARGIEYLASRPDWDGTTLVVTGNSQGGLQSFVTAGLCPQVTAVMVNVPAGCDNTAAQAGRAAGWPYWIASGQGKDPAKLNGTARYFDGMNFASRIRCPVLVGMGLADTTSRPDGVFAAINSLRGPVEVVPMPNEGHQGKHAAYYARFNAWRDALSKGQPAPVR